MAASNTFSASAAAASASSGASSVMRSASTSTTVAELRHHLRGFVSLLRARGIALDHAMLADDIVGFQRPGGAKKVRLAWARQYYSLPAETPPATDADPASNADSTTAPTQEN